MAQKLTNDDILHIIEAHEKQALGSDEGELSNDRQEALDRYHGEPYGDEQEGRSQVVSKDLKDAVDWIMPSLMRIFLMTEFLRFDPVGPEDVEQAEQESDYTNYVIMKENNGFLLLHDWFKDSLLLRNGYVKYGWDKSEKVTHETYGNLTEDELVETVMKLEASGDTIDIVGADTTKSGEGGHTIYEIKIRRTKKYGCVKIEPVPPEEIRVSRRTRGSIKNSPFVQHVTRKTRSELVEMGIDEKFVDGLSAWSEDKNTSEQQARDQTIDESTATGEQAVIDRSMDEIEYKESYFLVDWDGDGIAELRKVVVTGNKIPEGEDWNEEIDEMPFEYLTPNRMPHRHVGLSLQDDLEDIARIKTTLWRQLLDNTYLLNNLEWVINERANLDDFLTSRPGGLKRVTGKDPVEGAVSAVQKQPIIQHVLPVLDYMDTVKEHRSGVGQSVVGLDPDTLKKTTEGAARQALQQANAKIEMIARLFGETGVKGLALSVHALLIKHMDKQKIVQLRNKWVPVNPQEWKERTDLTVSVGLGTGSTEEIRSNLMLMLNLQQQAKEDGIVLPKNAYNLAEKLSDNLGFKQQGMFFTDPDSPQAQANKGPPPPDPLVQAEQIKAQSEAQIAQLKEELKHARESAQIAFDRWKFEQEHALAIAKAEIEALIKGVNVDIGAPGLGAETKTGVDQSQQQLQPSAQQQPIVLSVAEMQDAARASKEGNQQIAEMLMQLVAQNQQIMSAIVESMNRPRQIVLQKDASGRPVGATSTVQ